MKKIVFLSLLLVISSIGVCSLYADGTPVVPGTPISHPDIPLTDGEILPIKNPTTPPEKTLTIINNYYAVDDDSVYTVDTIGKKWVALPEVDRVSFEILGGRFARDTDQIILNGQPIIGADRASFSLISPEHGYAQDNTHVYGPQGLIPDADTQTFEMKTKIYSLDIGQVYANGRLIDADSGSFQVIHEGPYAYDKYRVFFAGKILEGVSPAGFRVVGTRGVTADGRIYEGAHLQGSGGEEPGNPDIDLSIPSVGPASLWSMIQSRIAPYKDLLSHTPRLWSLVGVTLIFIVGLLFVFFGHRNDESISLTKAVIKLLIALVIVVISTWIASHFLVPHMALIVGSLVGLFFFITLWSALGWARSIVMAVLTLISTVVGIALIVLIARALFPSGMILSSFVQNTTIQLMMIMVCTGIIVGTGLITSQLGSSLASSLGQSTIATVIAVVILGFFFWVSALSTPITITIFALLYGALLWIMRFRIVSDLFADSVRIFRVALLLGIIMGILVWFIL